MDWRWCRVLLLAGGVGLAGCPAQEPAIESLERDGGGRAAARDRAAEEKKKERTAFDFDAGVPAGFIDPIEARHKIRDPILYMKKVDELTAQLDLDQAPEYTEKLLAHAEAVSKIIRVELDDCDRAIEQLAAYLDAHQQEIAALAAEAEKARAAMEPEAREKANTRNLVLVAPRARSLFRTQSRFIIKYKDQPDKLAELTTLTEPLVDALDALLEH
jgi:hypothetical protein